MFQNVMQWIDAYGQSVQNGVLFGGLVGLFLVGKAFMDWSVTADKRIQWIKDEMDDLDVSVSVQVQSLSSRVSMLEQASRDRADKDRQAAADRAKPKVLAIKKPA